VLIAGGKERILMFESQERREQGNHADQAAIDGARDVSVLS